MVDKMGRIRSKLGCCFGSESQVDARAHSNSHSRIANSALRNGNGDPSARLQNGGGSASHNKSNRNGSKRVTIKEGPLRPQSPHSQSDLMSQGSGRSSVYFDASEGGSDCWRSLDGDDNDSFDESFATLQIDGQYFFNAKDDPNVSKEAFEGIKEYPPLPTTGPDPLPRSPISVSNMQTLLHDYQHSHDDMEEKKEAEDADMAAGQMGTAMENQAKRMALMTLEDAKSSDFLGQSTNLLLAELKEVNVREKGFPGELTETELEAVRHFQQELRTRDPIYEQIVRALSAVEKEAYALCRFLRARKFDVEKVFELLDEARPHFTKASENDFYPDLEKVLGFSRPVFLSQYPAVFCGNAKNGCPVMYLRLGLVQPDGIRCIVSLDKVDRYFWHDTTFHFIEVLKEGRRLNPQFVRTESITVYDLKGVSRSQISSDVFELIKVGNQVMSSFPETLHCLLLINAPGWFGFVWSVIKKLIDPRTASKIEVFTSSKAGIKRMEALIDKSQIPSDYGGTGKSLAAAAAGGSSNTGVKNKMVVLNQLLHLPKKNSEKSHTFELDDGEQMTLTLWTRCKAGASAALLKGDNGNVVTEIDVAGDVDDEPYSRTLGAICGPGKFTVKLKAKSQPGVFLILGSTARASTATQGG